MGKKQPKAPDPYATAQAQMGANIGTAAANMSMNTTNQYGPWGNVEYAQSGTVSIMGPDGKPIDVPRYSQITTLSPEQQALYDQGTAAQGNLAGLAQQLSGNLGDTYGRPMDTSGLPGLQSGFGGGYNPNFNGQLGLQTDLGLQNSAGLNTNLNLRQNAGLQTQLGDGFTNTYAGADDFSADRERVEAALWDRNAGDRAAQEEEIRTRLANSGIQPGSPAWNAEMERMQRQNTDARLATTAAGGQEQQRMVDMARQAAMFGNDSMLAQFGAQNAAQLAQSQFQNDARMNQVGANNAARLAEGQFGNQAALAQGQFGNDARMQQGMFGLGAQQAGNQAAMNQAQFSNAARAQGLQEMTNIRNQPLNEMNALLNSSQVQAPNYTATPQVGVGDTNVAGLVQQDYQNRLAQSQGAMGGFGGLFGSVMGAAGNAGGFGALFSDKRLKTDIERVGTTDGGVPLYKYRYVWGGPVHIGVMAQDVPEAAFETESGYLAVDYSKVA